MIGLTLNQRLQRAKLPIVLLVGCVAIDLYFGYVLFSSAIGFRAQRVDALRDVPGQIMVPSLELEKDVQAQEWARLKPDRQTLALALAWTVTHCRRMDKCSRIADQFREVVGVMKVPSRKVALFHNLFDSYDSHTIAEVLIDGKWMAMDPTFGLYYESREGEPLSAQQIKEKMYMDCWDEIRTIRVSQDALAERRPYMGSLAFYSNVFVRSDPVGFVGLGIPPLRYWFGQSLYYELRPKESESHIRLQQELYFLAVVLLPLSEVMLFWRAWSRFRASRSPIEAGIP
jgi:hypothetical protein